jgi:glycosyltransferase involved in cell wall biosynthesis
LKPVTDVSFSNLVNGDAPRKVVFVESVGAMGGVQFSTLYLAQHLDPARWEPLVVCPATGDLAAACSQAGIRTHSLAEVAVRSTSISFGHDSRVPNPAAWLWNGVAMLVAARRLARFLSQTKPHLVVTKGLLPHFYGGLATHRLGIPCIWHVQDFISERFFGLYRRVFSLAACLLPDHIIADGAAISRQLGALEDRVSVIHNGVDVNMFRPGIDGGRVRAELGLPAEATVIGHVGRMTPWKGQHYLLEAFASIAREIPNAYLLFVGDPVFDNDSYQNKLLNLTARLGLEERVKFAGYRHDIPEVLASMNVFAFTSVEKDTSPLTLLSAMSSGLPIVAFDIEGVRELIDGDEQFLLVPLKDSEALARSLRKLLADEALQRRLGEAARQTVEKKFSLSRYVSRMQEAFLSAVSYNGVVARRVDTGTADVSPASVECHSD